MSISISKQTDKVRFLTGNTTVVTKVYQQAKQKNSCQAFKNRLLHKRSISELNQSKIEVIPIQIIRKPQQLSTTQSASNILAGSQVNFEPNSEILELKKQLLIRDKKIAQLNAAIHQKTDQIAREKNNSFLTSRLHGKQIVSYEERINEYEKKISELNKSKEGQQSTQNKEISEQTNKLRVQKQRLQKEIFKQKQEIVRERKQWTDEKQKIKVEYMKQIQEKIREIIRLQVKQNQLNEENRKQREEKEKAIEQLIEFKKRVESLQQTIKVIHSRGSQQQQKFSNREREEMQQKLRRYIVMESEYKRVADEMLVIKQQLTKMLVIKQQLKRRKQQIQRERQQHRIKYQQLIQREKSIIEQKQKQIHEMTHQIQQLTNKINQLTNKVQQLTNKINQLTNKVQQLTKKINQLQTKIIDLNNRQSESIRTKQKRIIQLQSLLKSEQQQQEYIKLKHGYSQIQDKYFELLEEFNLQVRRIQTQKDKQIKQMKILIVNKDKQILRMNEKILEMQGIEEKLLQMQRELQIKSKFSQQSLLKIQQLTQNLRDKQVQINQTKDYMSKVKDENIQLVEENNRLNQRIKQGQLQVNNDKQKISNLTINIQKLNRQIENLNKQITQLRQQNYKQLTKSSQITSSKLNHLSQLLTQKQQQINQLKSQVNQYIKSNYLLNQNLQQYVLKIQSIQVNLKRAQHLNTLLNNENKILHQQLDALQHTTLYLKKQVTSTIENHQNSLKQITLLKQQTKRSKSIRPYPYRQRLSYTARSKYQHDSMRYQHNSMRYQHNSMKYQTDHLKYQTDRNNYSPYKQIYNPYKEIYNPYSHQYNTCDNYQNHSFKNYQDKVYRSASYLDTDLADRQKRSSKKLDQNFIHNMNLSAVSLDIQLNKKNIDIQLNKKNIDIQLNKKNISLKNNHRRTQTQPIEAIDQEGSEYEHNNKTICERGRLLHKISGVSSIMLGSEEEKFHLERDMTRSKDTLQNMIKPFSCESQHYCQEQSGEVSFCKQQ